MSSEEETPCDSNDYHLSLYSSLLDDDEYIMDILPCTNSTAIVNAGESSVEATVASWTTTPAQTAEGDISIENGAVAWETTSPPPLFSTVAPDPDSDSNTNGEEEIEEINSTVADVNEEAAGDAPSETTQATPPLFSTVASEPDTGVNGNGKEDTEEANSANVSDSVTEKDDPDNGEDVHESNAKTPAEPTDSESKEQHSSGETVHEETSEKSLFYTCHPNPSSLQSGDFAPDDSAANKYEIVYDYELLTKADAGNDAVKEILTELENTMTGDVAKQVGLVNCQEKLRRGLRKNKRSATGVVALDSNPLDEALEGQSCTTPAENTICTSVRGYMTVWSENSDISSVLQSIESGMDKGNYEADNIVKVVYKGVPTEEKLQQTGTNLATEASVTTRAQSVDGSTNSSGKTVFLPIGITVFAVAMAWMAFFVVRRRKNYDRNGPKPNRTQPLQTQLEAPPTMDLDDDINLLPSTEKLDMRPINETDSDTASAGRGSMDQIDEPDAEDDTPMKKIDDEDLQSVESSVFSQENESVESGSAASGLAAMGAASTLALRMGSADSTA